MRRSLLLAAALGAALPSARAQDAKKIPITTTSKEALASYLEGRDLFEKLRATDARAALQKAVARDTGFALGHLALANTAPSTQEFFAALKQAVALSPKATEAERHMILGFDAGVRSDPEGQRDHYAKLVAAYPNDERAHNLLAGHYFGRQDWKAAIEEYKKATAINPAFSQPYNQMGYAHRFLGEYDQAEQAFKKYIELIPGDPNPYDSYAELLMKMGRFAESIQNYEKALAADKNFVASYIGIGHDQVFMGQPEKARETYARLTAVARTNGERRQALFQVADSYVHEGQYQKAVEAIEKASALAEADGDKGTLPGDLNFIGNILVEAGQPDAALARFRKAVALSAQTDVPEAVKEGVRRNALANEARVALARNDTAGARSKAEEYAAQVAVRKVPFEVRQSHEINGLVALQAKDYPRAVEELAQANLQDPRVLFHLGVAYRGQGDAAQATARLKGAAEFNGLGFNYGFVRAKAKKLLAEG
ncbi:MAG TPA: tetratricopeptide repeat protein [Vicinamibacteria bacterium]